MTQPLGHLTNPAIFDPLLTPEQREQMAQLLADSGLEAIERSGEVQEAVDVAVEIVDVCLKVGSTATLDRALGRIDPEVMAAEVVLAFLTTTSVASSRLPARAELVVRFEKAIRTRERPDAEDLMRFVR